MIELPSIPRREFGFERTTCGCDECTRNCRFIPGSLVPSDLERMRDALSPGQDIFEWASENLLASPGAVVMYRGEMYRIPTLVPARGPDGMACKFLTEDWKCSIHTVAPYGCAFVDMHMTDEEGTRRSTAGLMAINNDWMANGLYSQVHQHLEAERNIAPPANELRRKMAKATL